MDKSTTPDWLVETQQKSWEPEILISGITLTFIFFLSKEIYNFYAMLIQDFGVYDAIGRSLNTITIIMLTGLKFILIIHLILRGVWTGFVGLSFVFPDGVIVKNLSKSNKNIDYSKPENFVIKIEKICSLLFSFIFSSIAFVIGLLGVFVPIVLLFLIGLDITIIQFFTRYIVLPLCILLVIFLILMDTRLVDFGVKQKIENSVFANVVTIYLTNIGKLKTILIFTAYFLIIGFVSKSEIMKFDFDNELSVDVSTELNIPSICSDHYEAERDKDLRISKATIDRFRILDNEIELFISFYKEDLYTLKKMQKDPMLFQDFYLSPDSAKIALSDIYKICIDEIILSDLKWYSIKNIHTNQKGIKTRIPLDKIENEYHELKIDKIYWSVKKKKVKIIENWAVIPFETGDDDEKN
ncbi:hypothetical protein KAR48_01120 [bacterium]|nr:hypothetical protein [bacterium]